jgi:hypothetical protein
MLFLDFASAFGKAVVIDVLKGSVASTITPRDPFFIQYINFYVGKTTLGRKVKVFSLFWMIFIGGFVWKVFAWPSSNGYTKRTLRRRLLSGLCGRGRD